METVSFECNHCGQTMAVSVEHLGTEVHCPHCQQVLQAPSSPPTETGKPITEEKESIFSSTESSDVFGAPAKPPIVEAPSEPPKSAPAANWERALDGEPADSPTVSLARRPSRGKLVPIVLILLIPYAIVSTGFIAWLLYNQRRNQSESLERMFDPAPKDGGPKLRVKHDMELPNKLRTTLAKAIQIGDLEVTPLSVSLNNTDDLTLTVRMKNTSAKTIFNPFPDAFLSFAGAAGMNAVRPYTFLQSGSEKIYGGFASWRRGPQGGEVEFDGILAPNEEMIVTLSTMDQNRGQVRRVLQSRGPHLWRLHVRRGFVQIRNEQHSATAVVGVEFPTSAIEKSKPER